jgi:hypothetical protein
MRVGKTTAAHNGITLRERISETTAKVALIATMVLLGIGIAHTIFSREPDGILSRPVVGFIGASLWGLLGWMGAHAVEAIRRDPNRNHPSLRVGEGAPSVRPCRTKRAPVRNEDNDCLADSSSNGEGVSKRHVRRG